MRYNMQTCVHRVMNDGTIITQQTMT